jgi:filamentous hemagglutinin family protein
MPPHHRSVFSLAFLLLFPCHIAQAQQVIPDSSINTIVSSTNNRNFTITGGGTAGPNLFHSFSDFSIPIGGSARFNHSPTIQNIFARVTGNSISNIDGTLQAQGSANLFLLNPKGVIFGPNASLQIGGSFLTSTASRIKFADGGEFSAIDPKPLLTVSAPTSLQMGQTPGAIQVNGPGHQVALMAAGISPLDRSRTPRGLQVTDGKTLALIGGTIDLVGGTLTAPGGKIELGSVSNGSVEITQTNPRWMFEYSNSNQFSDIQVAARSLVDASGNGGSIRLRGQNIRFSDESMGLIQHAGLQRGGDLILQANDAISFQQNRFHSVPTRLETQTLGSGSTGDIQLIAQRLTLQNGGMINNASYGSGGSGAIRVQVAETIDLLGAFPGDMSPIVSRLGAISFQGNTGNVSVLAKKIRLQDGASFFSTTLSQGQSGSLTVEAKESLDLVGSKKDVTSTLLSTATLGRGNGGNLVVTTPRLTLRDGGTISSSTTGSGKAGNLVINASDSLTLTGTSPDAMRNSSQIVANAVNPPLSIQLILRVPATPTGNAGNIIINTKTLAVSDRAQVGVNNLGSGDAGNLTINADRLTISNSSNLSASTASGAGGNIRLNLDETLILRENSRIDTQALGKGNGGNITIDAPIIAGLKNSDIIANAVSGRGGNIQLTTQSLLGLKFSDQLTFGNDITAGSELGINGTVQVNTIGVNPSSGIVTLPTEAIDPRQQVADGCRRYRDSRFIVTGRGGIPDHAIRTVLVDHAWLDLRAMASPNPQPRMAAASTPIEATAIATNAQGQIELLGTGAISPSHITTCEKK